MERILAAALALATLTACTGPDQVTVPDTTPPMTPPPAAAMQPCPSAERQGTGTGYAPDIEQGTRGEVMSAFALTVEYGRTCAARHQTLREHIDAYLDQQRPPQDR